MRDLFVRKLTAEDIGQLLVIEQSLGTAPHWPRQDYESCLQPGDESFSRVALVAECEGRLAGFAICVLVAGEAELESICVASQWQGYGVGSALLRKMLAELRHSRMKSVLLEVRASNASAYALYRRFGFVYVGRRRNYYSSPPEDAIHMRCELRT